MNDRELLELAAKAAGYGELIFRDGAGDDGYDNGIWTYTWRRDESKKLIDWNPLTNDGDALRLAVKLGIGTEVWKGQAWAWKDGAKNEPIAIEELGDDPYVATRRAIVCAAAEIGRMK